MGEGFISPDPGPSPACCHGAGASGGRAQERSRIVCQLAQQCGAVAAPRAAVHACKHRRFGCGQPLEQRARVARVREVIQMRAQRFAWPEDVALGKRRRLAAALGEQVTAEQRARALFHQISALPSMRHMRHIQPLDLMLAERERLSVGHLMRRPVGKVANRGHPRNTPAQRGRVGRRGEPFID